MAKVSSVLICPVVHLKDFSKFLKLSANAKIKVYRYSGRLDAQALLDGYVIEISVYKSEYRRKFYGEALENDSELKELEKKLIKARESRDWDYEDKLTRAITQKKDWHKKEANRKAEEVMQHIIKLLKDNGFIEGFIAGVEVFEPPLEWLV